MISLYDGIISDNEVGLLGSRISCLASFLPTVSRQNEKQGSERLYLRLYDEISQVQ